MKSEVDIGGKYFQVALCKELSRRLSVTIDSASCIAETVCKISTRKLLFSEPSRTVPHVGALLISVKRHSFRRLMTLFDFLNYVGLAVVWVKSIQRAEYM